MLKDYMNVLEKSAITGSMTALASVVSTGAKWRVRLPYFAERIVPLWAYCAVAGV